MVLLKVSISRILFMVIFGGYSSTMGMVTSWSDELASKVFVHSCDALHYGFVGLPMLVAASEYFSKSQIDPALHVHAVPQATRNFINAQLARINVQSMNLVETAAYGRRYCEIDTHARTIIVPVCLHELVEKQHIGKLSPIEVAELNIWRYIIQHEGIHQRDGYSCKWAYVGTPLVTETMRQLYRKIYAISERTVFDHSLKIVSGIGTLGLTLAMQILYARYYEQHADDGVEDDEVILSGGITHFEQKQAIVDIIMSQRPFALMMGEQSWLARFDRYPRIVNTLSQLYRKRNPYIYALVEFLRDSKHTSLQTRIAKLRQRRTAMRNKNLNSASA